MKIRDIMTKTPACCLPNTPLREVALAMVENNCGAIPVVIDKNSMRLVGIITDRDIICRTVAQGKNPIDLPVKDCMSAPVVTVTPDMSLEEGCNAMEANQVRRLPVTDEDGVCFGIITQAHIALHAPDYQISSMLKQVSRCTADPSEVATARAFAR